MAEEVQISPDSIERTAKIRHPVAVGLWTFLTGIYALYWWYQVNREMADLGRARGIDGLGERPFNSLLAFFPGVLIFVPPFVSLYNAAQRIPRAQREIAGSVTFNGWILLLLVVIALMTFGLTVLIPGYIQSELNKVWQDVAGKEPVAAPAQV
jgi:hypothetical protein